MVDSLACEWKARHRLWLDFVRGIANGVSAGNDLPIGPSRPSLIPGDFSTPSQEAQKVVLCSPHPDDEALVSALALRLRIEDDAEIVNCAVTLGSNASERPRRLSEVEASCRALGFRLGTTAIPSKGCLSVGPQLENLQGVAATQVATSFRPAVERLGKMEDHFRVCAGCQA